MSDLWTSEEEEEEHIHRLLYLVTLLPCITTIPDCVMLAPSKYS